MVGPVSDQPFGEISLFAASAGARGAPMLRTAFLMSEKAAHEGHRARVRERFLSGDAASRSDAALLELLLTYALPQRDVQPL